MLSSNRKVFIPVVLALFLFAVDKIAYIPAFQECCTASGSKEFFNSTIEYDFSQEIMIDRALEADKRVAMNFGSSRSLPYYAAPTPGQMQRSRFVNDADRRRAADWEIVNAAYPGSSILTSYIRFIQWMDHGVRPDVVFVELDPSLLSNRTMWFVTELKFGVPLDFAAQHIFEMPWQHTKVVFGSRVFAFSRYRLGENQQGMGQVDQIMERLAGELIRAERPEDTELRGGNVAGQEPPFQQLLYLRMTNVLEKELFNNYAMNPALTEYVFLILERARAEGVPVVFWHPPTHPIWKNVQERSVDPYEWRRLIKRIEAAGGRYVDLSREGVIECNEFIDPVHFAQICTPEIAARKLEFVESEVVPANAPAPR